MKKVLAFDFGASSGRAMLAELKDGRIEMREIHRFSNDTVIVGGTMYWDILRLFFEIKAGITKISGYKGGGCAYGVRINDDVERAKEILGRAGIRYRDII